MTSHHNLRTIAMAAAAALAMTLGAGSALAQPVGGPHGPGSPDQMIGRLIEHAKAQLNLNTSQQSMFDTAVAHSKAAHESGRALRQKVKDAAQVQLANAEPDLAKVAAVADEAEQQGRALRLSIRSEWLTLYATFTPEQKAVVRDMLQKKMARAESFREKMRERMQEHFGGKNG
jgi:Spy/CpxP family protein refolding chaperone